MTDRQSTHGHDCWSWGSKHYECAVREIERLRKMHQDAYQRGLQAGSKGLREMYDAVQAVKRQDAWGNAQLTEALMEAEERAERAEAENKQLRAEVERSERYAEQSERERLWAEERAERLAEALREWWSAHRPVGWTEDQHRARPYVNLITVADKALTEALLRDQEARND